MRFWIKKTCARWRRRTIFFAPDSDDADDDDDAYDDDANAYAYAFDDADEEAMYNRGRAVAANLVETYRRSGHFSAGYDDIYDDDDDDDANDTNDEWRRRHHYKGLSDGAVGAGEWGSAEIKFNPPRLNFLFSQSRAVRSKLIILVEAKKI